MPCKASFYINIGLLMCCASQLMAATGTSSGREPGLWDKGKYVLIVAHIVEVHTLDAVAAPAQQATHILTIEPIATLAGEFDPSRQPQIQARLSAGTYGSPISEAPPKDSTALVLIDFGATVGGDDARLSPRVSPDGCLFMPDELGLVILHGLDDKRIIETLTWVRKAREEGEAEAKVKTKRAETQPRATASEKPGKIVNRVRQGGPYDAQARAIWFSFLRACAAHE